jgi:uncharacterized membrane protein
MMDRASEAASEARRTPRWVKVALVASLALNLLILGTIGGSIWASRQAPTVSGRSGGPHMLGFTRTLPYERRFEIWKVTRHELRALRPLRKDVRRARAQARAVLVAQPFDKQKFAEAQTRVFEAEMAFRREAQALFVAIAGVLTPEERGAFAKWQPLRRGDRARQRDASAGSGTVQR